ncbi:MAG: endonuclease/exonuclease/phosphatase family protein [Gemmatimonadota bacterium]|nr:endonuclease/exonuclease/phosphatase family protein [Gemmatimonadota bacterium]
MNQHPRDIIVRCKSGRHRVRLAKGRFWSNARCSTCGAPVDAWRVWRILRWAAGLRVPATLSRAHRLVFWGAVAYLSLALVSAAALWWLGDRWWLATVLLFGPRWVLLLPLVVLVPAAILHDRPLLVPILVAGAVVLGPVMGFQTGWTRFFVWPDSDRDIRVATFNAKGGGTITSSLTDLMLEWDADMAAFQECSGLLRDAIDRLLDWHTHSSEGLCVVSRFPIVEVRTMDREALEFAGGAGLVMTYLLEVEEGLVFLTNVHLETPRAGLERIRAGNLDEGIPVLATKSQLREIELRRARRWADRFPARQIVAGDFNTPPESRLYRAAWSDWQNAFSIMGRGFGATRMNGWIRARIDHVLADSTWKIVRSWVADDVGSDHRPVVAQLRRR